MGDEHFERHRFNDGLTLKEYVESLLKMGKRSQAPEFQTLMKAFWWRKDDIIKWAREFIEKDRLENPKINDTIPL
jgi:hypothetical protein